MHDVFVGDLNMNKYLKSIGNTIFYTISFLLIVYLIFIFNDPVIVKSWLESINVRLFFKTILVVSLISCLFGPCSTIYENNRIAYCMASLIVLLAVLLIVFIV